VTDEQQDTTRRGPIKASTFPMWVLGLVVAVDATDQSIVRGVQSLIQKDFGLSDASVGLLASAFVFVHALITIPAGYLADRLNRKRVVGITIVLWSGITALSGACQNFLQLLGVRALLGFGLGVTEPSANSLLTDYYPSHQRGRAFSIQQLLLFVGFGLGIGLGASVGDALGWRWAFVIVGTPGVVTALLVLKLREPKRGHGDRLTVGIESSLDDDDEEQPKLFEHGIGTFIADMVRGLRDDIRTILAIPTLRFVLIGVGVLLFAVNGVGYWLPVYHERFNDLSVTAAGNAVAGMFVVGGVAGTLIGGVLADRYQNRIRGGRVAIPAYCVMAGTVLLTISFLPMTAGASLTIQALAVLVYTLALPSMRAGLGDAVPAHLRGAGFAAFALISAVSGAAAAPPLIGLLSDATDLRVAFLICMPTIFLGAVFLLRAREHLDEDVAKVLMAVQRAYQEQTALEQQRSDRHEEHEVTSSEIGNVLSPPDDTHPERAPSAGE
jgi:MFS family permease